MSAGVPTIWMNLLNHLRENSLTLDTLQRVIVGGAACPPSIITEFRDTHDVECRIAWGMTETSPLGTVNTVRPELDNLGPEDMLKLNARQGRPLFGVSLRLLDDDGNEQPWDGEAVGEVNIRGPWVCSEYFNAEDVDSHTSDGWLCTGDVANINPDGYMQITDRSKDIIKSGGEWISSIDLENVAVGHPAVAEAAVIGMPHPKWSERPLLIIVRNEGAEVLPEDILGFLEGKIAKWWMPDDVVFIDEIPHTATGKISKKDLRETFKDYQFPE